MLRQLKGRLDESMAVGNEGAGVVVAAGSSDAAQALLGKTVALAGGAMYSQYRCVKAALCSALPDGITAEQGASSFDPSATELNRSFGLCWALSGWLLTPYLQKIGFADMLALQQRVGRELTTTFASHYTSVISLADALNLDTTRAYASIKTGKKYLINPSL